MPFSNGTKNPFVETLRHIGNIRQITSTNTLRSGFYPVSFIMTTGEPNTSKSKDPLLLVKGNSEKSPNVNYEKVGENVMQVTNPQCKKTNCTFTT